MVVYFVQHFKQYLLGRRFILRVDHRPLLWLCNFQDASSIFARWISILGAYEYDLVFRPGHLHANADTMSRKPKRLCPFPDCKDCSQTSKIEKTEQTSESVNVIPAQSDVPVPNWLAIWSNEQIKEMQSNDLVLKEILRLKEISENKPEKAEISQAHKNIITLWNQWELLKIKGSILYREKENELGEKHYQLLAPREMQECIFQHLHTQRYAGHLGRDRTLNAIKKRFYWPSMDIDIARWVKECQMCARAKPGPGRGRNPIEQFKVFRPMSVMAIDILGPLPQTDNQNLYIVVCGCYFTKWKEAFAIPNQTAAVVADKLVTEVFLRLGVPDQIHTDQGRQFTSDLFQAICDLLGVEKTKTCPYNPKSDGLVERFNRTLVGMLSTFVNENRKDWDDHLPYVMAAYRATCHKSTGLSPNLMMLNREVNFPIDLMVGQPPGSPEIECPIQYVEWVKSAMNNAFEFAYGQLGVAASRQKRDYERGSKPREYQRGDWIWRWYPPTAAVKLGLGWVGPYLILKRITSLEYKIQKDQQSRSFTVHVDDMKPFEGLRHPVSWLDLDTFNEQPIEEDNQNLPVENQTPEAGEMQAEAEIQNRESEITGELPYVTPVPLRTRRGRLIKPRQIYSPE